MRVLHVINNLATGGAQGALLRLAAAVSGPVESRVVTLLDEVSPTWDSLLQDLPVSSLRMRQGLRSLTAFAGLTGVVRAYKPDLIQTWLYHADLLGGHVGNREGVPVIWNIRGAGLGHRSSRMTQAVVSLCARSSDIPGAIVSCTRRGVRWHVDRGYPAGKFEVIPNGYRGSDFGFSEDGRRALRREWGVNDGEFLWGSVARWDPQKDLPTLLAAFAAVRRTHPGTRLVLVGLGLGPDNAALSALVESAGLSSVSVIRVAEVSERRMRNCYSAFDGLVLSSAYGEGFPNVLAEGALCGCPIVATDVGDSALIVARDDRVAPPGSPAVLAGKMEAVVRAVRPGDRDAGARERVLNDFGMDSVAARYLDLWERALLGRRLRPSEPE